MGLDDIDFSEGSDGGGESGAESAAEARERFREQKKKGAQQAKRDKQEEKKRKAQDDTLAQIIVQFLNDPRYSGFFLLIARALSKNIPSDFLLSVLALIHKDSAKILQEKKFKKKESHHTSGKFPKELAKPLNEWTSLMYSVASAEPHRVLETILDLDWKVDENIIQLLSLVLREFFLFKKFETSFENIRQFSEGFLKKLSKELENQIQNQNILEEKKGKNKH